ncbi:MAG: hypothetical protein JO214_00685 [Frankiaceae bacterium]|nr:hypothetical protein [Frankiaceae bacterium]
MTGKRNGKTVRKGPSWLREQAEAQLAARTEKVTAEQTKSEAQRGLQELLVQLVTLKQRVDRLATFAADRCARIVELRRELRAEWERRVAAEARVAELEARLAAEAKKPPRKTPARKTVPTTN